MNWHGSLESQYSLIVGVSLSKLVEKHEFETQWFGDICEKIPTYDGWIYSVAMKKHLNFECTFAYVFQSITYSC